MRMERAIVQLVVGWMMNSWEWKTGLLLKMLAWNHESPKGEKRTFERLWRKESQYRPANQKTIRKKCIEVHDV